MANLILFQDYLIDRSIIDSNVDYKKIAPIIEMVQDIYLEPLLGSDLFDEIITQTTPPTTLSAANETLVTDHILKVLMFYVLAEAPSALHYRYMNKGIQIKSSDNSQPADRTDLKELFDSYKNKAETYGDRMKRYILANPTLYPKYFSNNTLDKELPKDAYSIDIFLTDRGYPAPTNDSDYGKDKREEY
jgi:hypothetical protein